MTLKSIFVFFLFFLSSYSYSQSFDSTFKIESIEIIGNKKTKDGIILRELTFKVGDTIVNWNYHAEQSRKQLINLFLFNEIQLSHNIGQVTIHVTERWYLWPIPILDYADRNFNQWWLTKDPKRLIYGVDLSWYNLRGRNETMVLNLVMGYTKSAGLTYRIPFFNKKKTWGVQLKLTANANREVWYATKSDKVVFFNDNDQQLIRREMGELVLTHRKKFFSYHNFYGGFRRIRVNDTVVSNEVNRGYLLYGLNQQKELYAGYQFVYDKRDFKGFPLSGHLLKVNGEMANFLVPVEDLQTLMFKVAYSRYFPVKGRFFGSLHGTARWYSNNFPQYTNVQALGYGKDYIRGYELFVIDGSRFALGKAELKYRFLSKKFKFLDHTKNYEIAPLSLFLSGYFDAGYVVNFDQQNGNLNGNRLPNSLQNGGGVGFNMVLFYDYCMRLEYSFDRYLNNRMYVSFVASM